MSAYNRFPAVDSTFNFPPEVRKALASATELQAAFAGNIRVAVVTGSEIRPASAFIIWIGGLTKPSNMIEGDIWLSAGSDGPTTPTTPTSVAPVITTTVLNSMTVGVAFAQTLAASGSTPITWALTSGSLPAGISLSTSGVLSGNPTTLSTFAFSITATNANGSDPQSYSGTVNSVATAPTISTVNLSAMTVGSVYSQTLVATGSTPRTWGVSNGSLPSGIGINSSTGVLSGTPLVIGTYTFTINVANAVSSNTRTYTITVAAAAPAAAVYGSIFGSAVPEVLTSHQDASVGSWLAQQYYVPIAGASLSSAQIYGARLYVPADSIHIGLAWRAALIRRVGNNAILYGQPASFAMADFDNNGSITQGSALHAGWNEIVFSSVWPGVNNNEAFLIGVQIGNGTAYLNNNTLDTEVVPANNNVNFVLAEQGSRSFYRGNASSGATHWYGIDCLVKI